MKAKLVNPYTTSVIEISPNEAKSRINRVKMFLETPPCRVPLANRFKYSENGKIAFCVPLYIKDDLKRTEAAVYGYIKRAFWLAYELLEFAGLSETGTAFYIVVQDKIRSWIEPYREICGFPENRILTVPDTSKWPGYMPNVYMLQTLCHQTNYQNYIRIDTTVHFLKQQSFCQNVLTYWDDHSEQILWATNPWRPVDEVKLRGAYQSKLYSDFDKFYSEIPKYFGLSSYDQFIERMLKPPVAISLKGMYGMPRNHICSEGYEDFLKFVECTQCIGNEEAFMEFYWHKALYPDKHIYNNPPIMRVIFWEGDIPDRPFNIEGRTPVIYPGFHEFYIKHYTELNIR